MFVVGWLLRCGGSWNGVVVVVVGWCVCGGIVGVEGWLV